MAKKLVLLFGMLLMVVAIFYIVAPYDYKVSKGIDFGLSANTQIILGLMLMVVAFFGIFTGILVSV